MQQDASILPTAGNSQADTAAAAASSSEATVIAAEAAAAAPVAGATTAAQVSTGWVHWSLIIMHLLQSWKLPLLIGMCMSDKRVYRRLALAAECILCAG